jgi:predicted RND superfamily exporter protein
MFALLHWLAQRPRSVLGTAMLISLVAAATCFDWPSLTPRFHVDPSAEALLPENDNDRALLSQVRHLFGEDDPVIVAVQFAPDVFNDANLAAIAKLTACFKKVDGVQGVFSLATAPNIATQGDEVTLTTFTEQARAEPQSIGGFAAQLEANPLYRGTLVSNDGKVAAFALSMPRMTPHEYTQRDIDPQLRALAKKIVPGAQVWITGTLPIRSATGLALAKTLRFTVPAVFGLVSILLIATFRSIRAAFAALSTVAMALIWTIATAVLLNIQFNLVTALVPPLVITIGLSYTIHLLSAYFFSRQLVPLVDKKKRSEWVMNRIGVGLLISTTTTIIGFLSLMLNPLQAIREFALLSSLGTLYVALLTFIVLPPFLNTVGCSREAPSFGQRLFVRWGAWLAEFDTRWRVPIILIAALLLPLNLWFASHIRTGADYIASFDKGTAVREDFETINRIFNGANVVSIFVDTHVNETLTDPQQIAALDALETWLRAQPEVGGVVSYVDHLKLLNQALNDNDPKFFAVPETAGAVKQILVFGGGDQIQHLVDPRFRSAVLTARINVDGSLLIGDFLKRLDARLAELPPPLAAQVTGSSVIATRAVNAIASGHLRAIGIATLAIWLVLSLMFTSLRAGLLATLPNLIPISVYFGTLGLLHINLNPTTSLVACIVLGIAVNDTVHFLARFNADAREVGSETGAIASALSSVLRPITLATAALCIGFLVFTGSGLHNQVQFGVLAAWTLLVAWFADMTLTPALGSRLRIVTLWDLLLLDLGRSPQHTIPLLSGLSSRQARVFALLSRMEKVPERTRLIQEGDLARDIYVIIDGQVDVNLDREDSRTKLASLGRGAVIGEAGYFGQRRTASIDTVTPVRVLRFDSQDLEGLRLRHPRIAAIIFRNLNRVQAERIANMTAMVR